VVEVGSYHGLSTAYLAQASKNKGKRVKSFDWFQGLSDTHPELDQLFIKGSLLSEVEDFDKNLSARGLRDVVDLTIGDAKTKLIPVIGGEGFSLAFLDVDLYDTTRDLLKQLKTLVRGGEVIILHDYHSPGIRRAASEFIDSFPGKLKISVIDPGALSPAIKIDIP
jgi:predicted O-methyltransferase YrrM